MAKRITDEIAAIAAASGYDGPAPKNKVEALNALALALGYDGAYQKRTADAINAVGTVAGGGGGGVDLGALAAVGMVYNQPTVGSKPSASGGIDEVRIGNNLAISAYGSGIMSPEYAAGLTLSTIPAQNNMACDFYVVTTDNTGTYTTVTPWDGMATKRETTMYGEPACCFDFVMPELEQGEMLYFWFHEASGK